MTANELLHDAEHKHSGAVMALRMGDRLRADGFCGERDELIARALTIDPKQADDAWAQTDLDPGLIGSIAKSLEREGRPRCPVTGEVVPAHQI